MDVYKQYNLRCFSVLYPLEDRGVYKQGMRITKGREVVVREGREVRDGVGGLLLIIPKPTTSRFLSGLVLFCFQGIS